ncbi:unnamed protein product [Linum tenue]|uniref:F-box domain-containing protein n=1 Tax=Linum tenue TaxID=586396 RepID=A0AAV0IFQ5_9ROSI|nr:unnamed protein product [Linum tenue]
MADQNQPPSQEPASTDGGSPHEALFLVLPYLSVLELLNVARVCTSLRRAVEDDDDILPWLNLVVERPLSRRLSDQRLIGISSRGKGRLKSLILVDCINVTDDGLQLVVSNNPLIAKLHVPGCIRLTPDGIIRAVKTLSDDNNDCRLKSLCISNILGINKQHFHTLCSYLQRAHKLGDTATSNIIDVDICPVCDEVSQVYACPQSSERGKCNRKGCKLCIPRCEECGRCADCKEDVELEEATLCSEVLCSECWLHLPKCNHCNQPYCTKHAYRRQQPQGGSGGGTGWLCEACHVKANEVLEHGDDDD